MLVAVAFTVSLAGAQQASLAAADRTFAGKAAAGGQAEVELGKLAQERGSNDAVRQFGAIRCRLWLRQRLDLHLDVRHRPWQKRYILERHPVPKWTQAIREAGDALAREAESECDFLAVVAR